MSRDGSHPSRSTRGNVQGRFALNNHVRKKYFSFHMNDVSFCWDLIQIECLESHWIKLCALSVILSTSTVTDLTEIWDFHSKHVASSSDQISHFPYLVLFILLRSQALK